MIRASALPWQSDDWRQILKSAIRDGAELLRHLEIERDDMLVPLDFGVLVPHTLLQRMEPGNPDDPLLRQVLSITDELVNPPDFVLDPLSERTHEPLSGLLQKYHGRVLLTLTGACPVHCRYCFRRHFSYPTHFDEVRRQALAHVARDESISEVILSGGDPLMLSDALLASLLDDIDRIDHVRRVRIHTRFPIAIPQRVTKELTECFARREHKPVVVIHANHPRELDQDVALALDALHRAGCQLLNQSVLLAGVNDAPGVLAELSERLFDLHVLPYYLHLLDRVHGAAHYDVPQSRASKIHAELKRRLPGYLVPRLVRESPGSDAKTELPASLLTDS